jgi:hypothetical protein
MSKTTLFCSVAGAMLLFPMANAQAPAGVEATAKSSAAAACRNPELIERPRITTSERERIGAAMQDYVDCMRPVLEAQRKDAEAKFADAKATAEASNAAANGVNALVDAYRKWEAEHKGDEAN